MALTGANRGVGGNNTSATTVTGSTNANLSAGSLVIFAVYYDNSGSQGSDPFSSITDSIGNTWTSQIRTLNDPGAASAGAVGAIFTTNQDVGTIQSGTTITLTFTTATVAKAWTLTEVTAASGYKASVTNVTGVTYSTATPTLTSGTITVGELLFGMAGGEGNSTTRTGDNDTTNGNWSTAQQTAYGSTTTAQQIISQYKIQTTTDSTQTYNPTFTTTHDGCLNLMTVDEVLLFPPKTYYIFLD